MATASPLLLYVKTRKLAIANPRRRRHRHRHASRERKGAVLTKVMKYAVPLVVALQKPAPFWENPAAFLCFVAATCAYWLTVGATKRFNGSSAGRIELYRKLSLALGILSALSLLSMFLPHPVSLLPLLMWMPLALLLTWPAPCRWIITKIRSVAVRARCGGGGVNSNGQLPILPV